MSWIDRVKTDLIIQTGDGKKFTPDWINAKVVVPWQIAEFEYPEVQGTQVDRREQKGSRFNLEIFFQGDDHLDRMKEFVFSAKDKRYWTISHPLYDILTVQPVSMSIDNSKYNVSKITIPLIQTIVDIYPKVEIIIEDKVEEDSDLINEANAVKFDSNVTPSSSDKNKMDFIIDAFNSNTINRIDEDSDGKEFSKRYNDAKSKIGNSTNFAVDAIRAIQLMISGVAFFSQCLGSRVTILKRNNISHRSIFLGNATSLQNLPLSHKYLFQSIGGTILTALVLSAAKIFCTGDYSSRIRVVRMIDDIQAMYDQYIFDLDDMQTGSGGDVDDFVADGNIILNLNNLVNFTMGNLFNLALDAKQERILVLEDDSDFVTLTHRLYGLKQDDSTIEELIRNNELGLNAMLVIPKGTEIKYYI